MVLLAAKEVDNLKSPKLMEATMASFAPKTTNREVIIALRHGGTSALMSSTWA